MGAAAREERAALSAMLTQVQLHGTKVAAAGKAVQQVEEKAAKAVGRIDELSAEVATPLALVIAELLQNCVEHAFPYDVEPPRDGARVTVHFDRGDRHLRVVVADNGVGLPEGTSLDDIANLGLRISRTLLETELGGTFDWCRGNPGTTVELHVPLRPATA